MQQFIHSGQVGGLAAYRIKVVWGGRKGSERGMKVKDKKKVYGNVYRVSRNHVTPRVSCDGSRLSNRNIRGITNQWNRRTKESGKMCL